MNRKQVVNELFAWPEISQENSKIIVQTLLTNLKMCPELKRKKTPPKHIRQKLKNNMQQTIDGQSQSDDQFKTKTAAKRNFIFGINSVTKQLEKEPKNVLFVLVCRSCKPLIVLTRHLQVMCSQNGIPAACVYDLSDSLSKLIHIKTAGAFAFCNKTEEINDEKISLIKEVFEKTLIPHLKPLKNPFTGTLAATNKIVRVDWDKETFGEIEKNENKAQPEIESEIVESKEEQTDDFGADFISINKPRESETIEFSSSDFIMFKEDFVSNTIECNQFKNEEDLNERLNFNVKFNQLSIIQQRPNKNREAHLDLKNKKMKKLENKKYANKQKRKNNFNNKKANNDSKKIKT